MRGSASGFSRASAARFCASSTAVLSDASSKSRVDAVAERVPTYTVTLRLRSYCTMFAVMLELANRVADRSPPLKSTSTASAFAMLITLSVIALTSSREYIGGERLAQARGRSAGHEASGLRRKTVGAIRVRTIAGLASLMQPTASLRASAVAASSPSGRRSRRHRRRSRRTTAGSRPRGRLADADHTRARQQLAKVGTLAARARRLAVPGHERLELPPAVLTEVFEDRHFRMVALGSGFKVQGSRFRDSPRVHELGTLEP